MLPAEVHMLSHRVFSLKPLVLSMLVGLGAAGGASALQTEGQEEERPRITRFGEGDEWITDFTRVVVPIEEIVSAGPVKDGIPAIDAPQFVTAGKADRWLKNREPVAVVRADGVVKAYPLQILIHHEIVNDVVGERAISVTFCPLCNTTLAFERDFDGQLLDFGTTGRLRHSDLVMYDRQSETWWQQVTGEGIIGKYAGRSLTMFPAPVMSWKDVKERFPDVRVLSRETGFRRPYGRNPYPLYDRSKSPMAAFFRFGREDDRLKAMDRVVALESNDEYLAVPFRELNDVRVANVEVGNRKMVVFWKPGTASALDARNMASGRDVGASAVYDPSVAGRVLNFERADDDRFRDRETGSLWDITGLAIEGELAGTQLEDLVHGNHFWFAWGTFRPETEIWRK
jgi:uncharacterized protein DUF3179